MNLIHISFGGPEVVFSVRGKERRIEIHPYFGPIALNARTGEPTVNYPPGFWDVWERFDAGRRVVVAGYAVAPPWCSECRGFGRRLANVGGLKMDDGVCTACEGRRVELLAIAKGGEPGEGR
jgi:hypothetical protein